MMAVTETVSTLQMKAIKLAAFCLKTSGQHKQMIKKTRARERPYTGQRLRNHLLPSQDVPQLYLNIEMGNV